MPQLVRFLAPDEQTQVTEAPFLDGATIPAVADNVHLVLPNGSAWDFVVTKRFVEPQWEPSLGGMNTVVFIVSDAAPPLPTGYPPQA